MQKYERVANALHWRTKPDTKDHIYCMILLIWHSRKDQTLMTENGSAFARG